MSVATSYSILQVIGITSFVQHFFIVIGFQKCSMTLTKMFYHMTTWRTDVRKYTNINVARRDHETVRITRIMKFRKWRDRKVANIDWLIRLKTFYVFILQFKSSSPQSVV